MGNNESFVTKQDLMRIYKISEVDIPQKTDFFRNPKDSEFQKNYAFIIDWQERIRTTKNRILDTLASLVLIILLYSLHIHIYIYSGLINKNIKFLK